MPKATKWDKGQNNGNIKCACCGKVVWKSRSTDDKCNLCYDSAEQYNSHVDGCHEPGSEPVGCPICAGVECLHEKVK